MAATKEKTSASPFLVPLLGEFPLIRLRLLLLCVLLTFCLSGFQGPENHQILQQVRTSIFKILVQKAPFDPLRPWLHEKTEMSVGSGFYIGKNQAGKSLGL